ncbi:MAG: DUF2155 domain-containing protein, partial [Acetobacteraceae bacterium]
MREQAHGSAAAGAILFALGMALPLVLAPPLQAQPAQAPVQTAPAELGTGEGASAPVAPVQVTPVPAAPAQAAPVEGAPAQGAAIPGLPSVGTAPAPPPPPEWLPRHSAVLQIVEKIDATHRDLTVPVGGTAALGRLEIEVKACLVRPPGQERDAAAYLDIVGKDKAKPLFQGWMLAAEPAVSIFQDPIYDV